LGWDFNENDTYSVRISDPHLQQAPRLPFGCTHDLDTDRLEALVFGTEIPDLYPEGEVASRCPIPDTGDFQVASAEEEDQPRIVAVPELSVDSKTKRVLVETSTAISVGRSQQDPTTEDVHTPDHAAARACLLISGRTIETWLAGVVCAVLLGFCGSFGRTCSGRLMYFAAVYSSTRVVPDQFVRCG
jgi:hypothetical protein